MISRAVLGARWLAWRHALLTAACLSALGCALILLPALGPLQETVDLAALFRLRGSIPPPDDIVLITIDQQSAERISLPVNPEARARCVDLRVGDIPSTHERLPPPHLVLRWPRCVHALALRALAGAGARVITLDISFRPLTPMGSAAGSSFEEEQDRMLAGAIGSAGNVLLAQWLDPIELRPSRRAGRRPSGPLERPARISPAIETAALGDAPLRLTWGMSGRVNGFAVFSEEDGLLTSLPALIVQLSMADVHADLVRLISRIRPEDAEMLPATADQLVERRPLQATSLAIRSLVRSEPGLADFLLASLEGRNSAEVPARHRSELAALVNLFSGDDARYLNFYGPPGTFRNVSYADVLKAAVGPGGHTLEEVRGKIAIIGYADFTPAQRDDHYSTVYTTSDGVKLSGIELLATAVANLQTGSSLVAPAPAVRAAVALAFGFAVALLLLLLPPAKGLAATAGWCAAYLSAAVVLFRSGGIWLPVLIPLFIQLPLGILYAITHHYRDMRRKRDELRVTFGKFVPDQVIDTLLQKRAELDAVTDPVYGICLATDAERFSTLAESMHPGQLARLLNRYFEAVFPPITKREGVISDIIGDMVLAFWTNVGPSPAMHAKACSAALELKAAVDEFNAASAGGRLPTRIGISAGPVTTSAIGAFDRFEFRPIGDTVVTSARLQELSKMLGTRILATEPVIHGLDSFLVRDVGTFLLRGKKQPSHVYELLGERSTASAALLQLCLEFTLALEALRAGTRENALARFRAIRERYPQDGPTTFYVHRLSSHRMWNGDAIPQP